MSLSCTLDLCHEGLFRKTGSISRQKELSDALDIVEESDLAARGYTVHDCASVLKAKLAQLAEPLLMDRYFNALMHTDSGSIYLLASTSNMNLTCLVGL